MGRPQVSFLKRARLWTAAILEPALQQNFIAAQRFPGDPANERQFISVREKPSAGLPGQAHHHCLIFPGVNAA